MSNKIPSRLSATERRLEREYGTYSDFCYRMGLTNQSTVNRAAILDKCK
jgi:hypothetical protein